MKRQIEILAPAGDINILKKAIQSGADAVYFGSAQLNARRNATNFSEDEFFEAVKYCHLNMKKAYMVLNTIFFDSEISLCISALELATKACVDAVIVQDLGLLKLIREVCPELEIHASTQMSAHNVSDAVMLKELGFSRVVLSREMSLKEIARVISSCDIETEVFVHGALCMSVSGQCYFSSALGDRSGNRGLCAQGCRLPYHIDEKQSYALSLKDMSYIDHIKALETLGVTSAKIEGRMKNVDYVSNVVKAFNDALSNKAYSKDKLSKIFSRSGFTDGYLYTNLGRNMFGMRDSQDKNNSNGISKEELKVEAVNKVDVELYISAFVGRELEVVMIDQANNKVKVCGAICQEAQSKPLTKETVLKQMKKFGDSVYNPTKIEVDIGDNVFLAVSMLNEIRRLAVGQMNDKRINTKKQIEFRSDSFSFNYKDKKVVKERLIYTSLYKPAQLNKTVASLSNQIIIPLMKARKFNLELLLENKQKVILELPRVYFSEEKNITNELKYFKELGFTTALCHSLGKILLSQGEGYEVIGGYGLNVNNSLALASLREFGVKETLLSCEIPFREIDRLKDILAFGVVGYAHFPLMIMRNCPIKAMTKCRHKNCYIKDRKNKKLMLQCDGEVCEMLNNDALYLGDKQNNIRKADFIYLMFRDESGEECISVINATKEQRSISSFTRGAYSNNIK